MPVSWPPDRQRSLPRGARSEECVAKTQKIEILLSRGTKQTRKKSSPRDVGRQGSITKSAKRLGHCHCGCGCTLASGWGRTTSHLALSPWLPMPTMLCPQSQWSAILFCFSPLALFTWILFWSRGLFTAHLSLSLSLSLCVFPSRLLAFYLCILVCSERTLISCNLLVAKVARQQVERFRRFITQKFTVPMGKNKGGGGGGGGAGGGSGGGGAGGGGNVSNICVMQLTF